jgi:ATP-binding cassette subfamily B protein
MLFHRFPVEYQMDSQDCGPASLKIIAKHFGKYYSLQFMRDRCGITKEGVSLLDLSTGVESIELRTLAIKCTNDDVVNSIQKGENQGVLLAVEPTADFKDSKAEKVQKRNSFTNILKYFFPYKRNFGLIFVIMLVIIALQGMLPFISKAVIDVDIKTSDVKFINMVPIGNISILLSVMIFNVLRDWILLHITARVNIALISDYLIKLMKLPVPVKGTVRKCGILVS